MMWHWLDLLLMSTVVLFCALYALYALSSVRMKRSLLTMLARCFGTRVFNVFSPRLGGCSNCDAGAGKLSALSKNKN